MIDHPNADEDEGCSYCGDGDPVPALGYWKCPRCDAEWGEDEAPSPPSDTSCAEKRGVGE